MTAATLVPIAIQGSLILIVFSLGLQATLRQGGSLLRNPRLLFRTFLAMNVIMPALALAAIRLFDFDPAVKIAMFALAVSPIPPLLPNQVFKAGGDVAYTIGLLASTCVLAVLVVPVSIAGATALLGRLTRVQPQQVVSVVVVGVLIPLVAGMSLNELSPNFARRAARPLSALGTALLLAALLIVVVTFWRSMTSLIGRGMLAAFVGFSGIGLLIGHLMGGPDPRKRTVLAMATASRHPGVALAVAHSAFPGQQLAVPAVVAYLLIQALVATPYLRWVSKNSAAQTVAAGAEVDLREDSSGASRKVVPLIVVSSDEARARGEEPRSRPRV